MNTITEPLMSPVQVDDVEIDMFGTPFAGINSFATRNPVQQENHPDVSLRLKPHSKPSNQYALTLPAKDPLYKQSLFRLRSNPPIDDGMLMVRLGTQLSSLATRDQHLPLQPT